MGQPEAQVRCPGTAAAPCVGQPMPLLCAVGNFKYVGLFKRVKGSCFARLDTRVYSPLCLALSAGVAFVTCGPPV